MRTADWFGIDYVFCSEDTVDPYNAKVIQASMGAFIRVNCMRHKIDQLRVRYPALITYGTTLTGHNIYEYSLSSSGIIDLIRILPVPPQIILTTAYQEYAVEAFEVGVVDYLVKPIEFSRFLRAANKLISPPSIVPTQKHQGTLAQREYQFFRVNKQMIKIFFDEILYVEGLKDYSKIITLNQVVVVRGQISTLEKRLSPHGFLRIHRSFLVNISQIKSYGANQIDVQLKKLPIGRSYKVEVAKVMQAITSSSNLTML